MRSVKKTVKIILSLAVILPAMVCWSEVPPVVEVTSTSAKLVVKGQQDCVSGGRMHFEYADSRVAIDAGNGQKTPEVHIGQNTQDCADNLLQFDRTLSGLLSDTTYYYRQCWSRAGILHMTCSSTRQFTTREPPGLMQHITARNGDLFRHGKRFRVFGVQNLDHEFERHFYTERSAENRARMTDTVKEARTMGANAMRIHLQLFDFIGRDANGNLFARHDSFENLIFLQAMAAQEGLYLLVSGNNLWVPSEVPAWYDKMSYRERWEVQAFFFEQVAAAGAESPSILAYELMSEPTISTEEGAEWYIGELGDYRFAQSIANGVPRDQAKQVARDWINRLTSAIRKHDANHLITFGANAAFPGGPLGIENTAPLLDIVSPHIYPKLDDPEFGIRSAQLFAESGKPVVVGETHLFMSNAKIYRDFLTASAPVVDGHISFFNGTGPDDMIIDDKDPQANALAVHRTNLQILQSLRGVLLEQ